MRDDHRQDAERRERHPRRRLAKTEGNEVEEPAITASTTSVAAVGRTVCSCVCNVLIPERRVDAEPREGDHGRGKEERRPQKQHHRQREKDREDLIRLDVRCRFFEEIELEEGNDKVGRYFVRYHKEHWRR